MLELTPQLLRMAYVNGYFPMPDDTGEILWYNPDPRAILPIDGFHVSRSLKRTLQRGTFSFSINKDFLGVMEGCAARPVTWINDEIRGAYLALHQSGEAHSVEVWHGEELVGGVYGVSWGKAFFAESMFHYMTDASKAALYHLVATMNATGMELLEVQFLTPHLQSLGAKEISSKEYMQRLTAALQSANRFDSRK